MCGLAGIVAFHTDLAPHAGLATALARPIAHRGPDGQGVHHWQTPASSGLLVHCRLAVIDPDPRANQPFLSADGRLALVFNGEIYNYRDLRADIDAARPGFPWRTRSDTEVLLAAYDTWGAACLDKLRGMFAFALFDARDHSLLLARDRMGQKPLYYATHPDPAGRLGAIAFASELSALAAVPWLQRTIDPSAIADYLAWGYIPSPKTIYTTCRKLPPAHLAAVTPAGIQTRSYFDPNRPSPAPAATRDLILDAVRQQLVSDVPLGCFLSGGVDSSICALAMTRCAQPGQKVATFSIGFEDPRYDETEHARRVAAHLGTDHHAFTVTPDAAADLPRLARVFGEPFADSSALPTHYLARHTRQHVTVALSGDGGDELFAGYDRYRALRLTERIPAAARAVAAGLPWGLLPASHAKSRGHRLRRLGASLALPVARRYASYLRLFSPALLAEILADPALASPPDAYLDALWQDLSPHRGPAETAMAVDRLTYLPEDLLTKVDRASMLHALEVRSPFMDHILVAHAAALRAPDLYAAGRGKKPLRDAFAHDLPPEVFTRPKMGFAVPVGQWLRGPLGDLLRDLTTATGSMARQYLNPARVDRLITQHATGRDDHAQRLYALLMLELWQTQCAR